MNMKNSTAAVEVVDLEHYWLVVRRQLKKIIALSFVATLISVLIDAKIFRHFNIID
jgi:succinoglycan biosynthesis transport protein ExoP